MTYRVLVCGGRDYADAAKVRWALERLARKHGALAVFDLGDTGADAGARWYRSLRGWAGETAWHLTAVAEVRPDYVLCFGYDDRGVTNKARSAGVPVGEVL